MGSMLKKSLVLALALGLASAASAQESETEAPNGAGTTIQGTAVALNGSTLIVDGTPVRLFGIETPDMQSAEGRQARISLDEAIAGRPTTCSVLGVDRNQMRVARCAVADQDLSLAQLSAGAAAVNRVHTRSEGADEAIAQAFDDAEAKAREAGTGLWRSEPDLSEVVSTLKAIEQQEPKVVVQPAAQPEAGAAAQAAAPALAPAMPAGLGTGLMGVGLETGILVLVAAILGVLVGFGLSFAGTWWLHRRRAAQDRIGLATGLYEEILVIGQRMHALSQFDDNNAGIRSMLEASKMLRTRTIAAYSLPEPVIYTNTGDRLGHLGSAAVAPVVAFYTAAASIAANLAAAVSASPTEQLAAPQVRDFAQRWLEAETRAGEALTVLRKIVDPRGQRPSRQEENRTIETLAAAAKPAQPAPAKDAAAAKPTAAKPARSEPARPEPARPAAKPTRSGTAEAPRRIEPTV